MQLRILCKVPGFRRAGVAHPAEKVWPAGSFNEAQIAQLKAEPLLTVIELSDGDEGSSNNPLSSEGAPGIAPGTPQGTAGEQSVAGQENNGGSSHGASDEAGQGAENGATSSSAPATDTKPKGGKPKAQK